MSHLSDTTRESLTDDRPPSAVPLFLISSFNYLSYYYFIEEFVLLLTDLIYRHPKYQSD
jgi:hypothetical protein